MVRSSNWTSNLVVSPQVGLGAPLGGHMLVGELEDLWTNQNSVVLYESSISPSVFVPSVSITCNENWSWATIKINTEASAWLVVFCCILSLLQPLPLCCHSSLSLFAHTTWEPMLHKLGWLEGVPSMLCYPPYPSMFPCGPPKGTVTTLLVMWIKLHIRTTLTHQNLQLRRPQWDYANNISVIHEAVPPQDIRVYVRTQASVVVGMSTSNHTLNIWHMNFFPSFTTLLAWYRRPKDSSSFLLCDFLPNHPFNSLTSSIVLIEFLISSQL